MWLKNSQAWRSITGSQAVCGAMKKLHMPPSKKKQKTHQNHRGKERKNERKQKERSSIKPNSSERLPYCRFQPVWGLKGISNNDAREKGLLVFSTAQCTLLLFSHEVTNILHPPEALSRLLHTEQIMERAEGWSAGGWMSWTMRTTSHRIKYHFRQKPQNRIFFPLYMDGSNENKKCCTLFLLFMHCNICLRWQ